MSDYKKTLNLPATTFPMKASLTQNEPKILERWASTDAYNAMVNANDGQETYVLHDGPPYANGHIHIGHAMNKILKDIIVKHRNMTGRKAQYVPGWDCHGLPIELKVEQELGGKTNFSTLEIRQKCREYALKYLDIQREEFKRLGVLGTWDKPYLTMTPDYETATARELANFYKLGSVQRNKKPIYWCGSCETALAEAEVEYDDHASPSIYVRFPLRAPELAKVFPQAAPDKSFIVIWTTTPWTIPDNLAVAVHPDFEYDLIRVGDEFYILAKELVAACAAKFGWASHDVVTTVAGGALEGLIARHPFYDRPSPVVTADYVTLDAGTGCVHTAPGHGREDYETGLRHGLDILSPLDDQARFLPSVEFFGGKHVFEANPLVIAKLTEVGHLLGSEKIKHSYPHCWRCKKPVIFRATTQWFITMEHNNLRSKALDAIDNDVRWIPAWGKERIHNMIKFRPDWCISRQRMWGVPIIALLCKDCGEAFFDADWAHGIVDRFATHPTGADYWFEAPLEEIVPQGLTCPKCGGRHWEKEDDILDVWFDSGTSFAAVVEGRPECRFPADLYLEGTDQHRGWFHSSLLAAVGTRDVPPYKAVLTHGFVLDGQGRKMSKSIGNVVAPQEIIEKHGAEVLRLWVASENYQEDLRISDEIIGRLVDAYRKIRNTCRFILGNLNDFNPATDRVPFKTMLSLDRHALNMVRGKHRIIQAAYENFEFHKVYHTLHNLCITDLSSYYLDIIKDRVYVNGATSLERRSAQTALYHILLMIIADMTPILTFTAEELFQHLPEAMRPAASTVLALRVPEIAGELLTEDEAATWELVFAVRGEVTKAIEPLRQSKALGHSLDARVTLFASGDTHARLAVMATELRDVFIVSQTVLTDATAPDTAIQTEVDGLALTIEKARGEKCARCWIYDENLGSDPDHPLVCPRCAKVLREHHA
ncbi:MAG: isoleucine--tRNA ligase [Deltaproteobacteria bacterium]|nr:isoleucine--tRNA ligase [Deltaproteobacteria bacterium]